jgi:hypothetical protein
MGSMRNKEDTGLDMTTRPASSSSLRPHPASSVDKPGSRGAASSTGGDDEIFIVAEKEGTRPRGVPSGPPSGSDPMHHRLNGLDDRLHPRNSPAMLNGPAAAGGHKPGGMPGVPPSSLAAASPAGYYSRAMLGHDPYYAAAASLPPTSVYSLASHHQMAGLDPRTAAMMSQPLLGNLPGAAGMRGGNPYDPMSMALDPFRDPYRDLFRDPLREARDRELMDRAKMMQLAASGYSVPGYYSSMVGGPGGAHPGSSMHKLVPPGMYPPHTSAGHLSSLGIHGLMGGLPPTHSTPSGLGGHHSAAALGAAGLSGHPSLGLNGAPSYKDPNRR